MPTAVITGVAGQDGSYLAEFLIEKGYVVYGMVRRSSSMMTRDRLKNLRGHQRFHIVYGDITDISSIQDIINKAFHDPQRGEQPLEVYNLAAQSHVKVSFDTPIYTTHCDAIGVLNVLESILKLGIKNMVRFYQASTSELYGSTMPPQNETSLMQPQSPYGVAKLYAYWLVKNYRDAHGMYVVNGILFNHESERRAENFVTRKITLHVAKTPDQVLGLGNLYAKRDWGYAKDYVEAMWLMLQQPFGDDYVVATEKQHTVKEFVELAYNVIDRKIRWEGNGIHEKGYDADTGRLLIVVDPAYFRPTEVDSLMGDTTKVKTKLGWVPKHTLQDIVRIMVEADMRSAS